MAPTKIYFGNVATLMSRYNAALAAHPKQLQTFSIDTNERDEFFKPLERALNLTGETATVRKLAHDLSLKIRLKHELLLNLIGYDTEAQDEHSELLKNLRTSVASASSTPYASEELEILVQRSIDILVQMDMMPSTELSEHNDNNINELRRRKLGVRYNIEHSIGMMRASHSDPKPVHSDNYDCRVAEEIADALHDVFEDRQFRMDVDDRKKLRLPTDWNTKEFQFYRVFNQLLTTVKDVTGREPDEYVKNTALAGTAAACLMTKQGQSWPVYVAELFMPEKAEEVLDYMTEGDYSKDMIEWVQTTAIKSEEKDKLYNELDQGVGPKGELGFSLQSRSRKLWKPQIFTETLRYARESSLLLNEEAYEENIEPYNRAMLYFLIREHSRNVGRILQSNPRKVFKNSYLNRVFTELAQAEAEGYLARAEHPADDESGIERFKGQEMQMLRDLRDREKEKAERKGPPADIDYDPWELEGVKPYPLENSRPLLEHVLYEIRQAQLSMMSREHRRKGFSALERMSQFT